MPGSPAKNRRLRINLDPDGVFPTACRAVTKNGPCRRSPVIGSPVCRSHGAAAPHVRAAADARVAELSARRESRAILAGMLLDLDAEPVTDPAALVMRLAARSESGFVEAAKRIEASLLAGGEPSETDLGLFKFFGQMASKLGLDMTRLQIGAAAMARYGPSAGLDGAVEGSEDVPVLADTPDVADIVSRVLATEHELETERLVRVEQARSMGGAQGQLPAGLTVVGETEQAS
jgi:hypothetical protein